MTFAELVRLLEKQGFSLRVRAKITTHFHISYSGHLRPIFTRTILNVGLSTLAVVFLQIDPIWPKSEREFCEVIFARTLMKEKGSIAVLSKNRP